MRFFYAIKVFFQILFSAEAARKVHLALYPAVPDVEIDSQTKTAEKTAEKVEKKIVEKPLRSDALTLLAALQREARFIDFLQENIQPYDDAQIGVIVRDVHRGCAEVVKRMFNVQPLTEVPEGQKISLDAPVNPQVFQLIGKTPTSSDAVSGTVVHPGWKAESCNVPVWSGTEDAIRVIAPVEIDGVCRS